MSENEIETIRATCGVTVPAGARVLLVDHQRGGDQRLRAKFVLPAAELDGFLAANGLAATDFEVVDNGLLGSDHGAWDPQARPPMPVWSGPQRKDGSYLYLGYEPGDGKATVYLLCFST